MDRKMAPLELRKHIIEFLKEHKSAALGTCMDGMPRTSPVQYFIGKEMDLYILSAGGDKFKAIEKNPNVCLLVNTEYINYRRIKGVQIFGRATTSMDNPSLFQEAQRYSPDAYLLNHEGSALKVIKIIPTEVVYLDSLEDGDRTKQILRHEQVTIRPDEMMSIH